MSIEQLATIMQDMMLTTLLVSAPVLITGVSVGFLIAVFQAATQINEQTLSFVPKVVLVFAVFGALFPWMMQLMIDFGIRILDIVATQGGP